MLEVSDKIYFHVLFNIESNKIMRVYVKGFPALVILRDMKAMRLLKTPI